MNEKALQAAIDMDRTIMQLAAERADLQAKLAAAQAELHDLRIRAGLAGQGWQPVEEGERVTCPCPDYSCSTEAWIEGGDLWIEDADEMRVSFHMGRDYAFMRRVGANHAAT